MGGWGERGRLEATIRNLGRPAKQSPPSLLPSFLPLLPLPSWKRTVAESTRRGPRILPAESVFFEYEHAGYVRFSFFLLASFLFFATGHSFRRELTQFWKTTTNGMLPPQDQRSSIRLDRQFDSILAVSLNLAFQYQNGQLSKNE